MNTFAQFILLQIPPHLVRLLGKIHALSIEVLSKLAKWREKVGEMLPYVVLSLINIIPHILLGIAYKICRMPPKCQFDKHL